MKKVRLTTKKGRFISTANEKRAMVFLLCAFAGTATMFGQDAFSDGLTSVETSFRDSWWPSIRNIAYILAGVAAVFGLVKVFQQSQRGEDNVSKVAGAWATGLAVFLIGIWAVDTFIIAASV